MLTPQKIERLNELAKKKKLGTLTDTDAKEQQELRQEYLANFRSGMKETIENVKVIDPKGNDVTPDKVKDIKAKRAQNQVH